MAISTTDHRPVPPAGEPVSALEMGDHLARAEFERRYWATPGLKKAELIEGMVYLPSPVSRGHGRPHLWLGGWLTNYVSQTPGLDAADNATVRFDDLNEPQPDLLLAIETAAGGQARVDEDDYFAGPPELVAEIALSSVSYDLHSKLRVYQREGVREYVVWRTRDKAIDWFQLRDGQFEPIPSDASGIVKSSVFPGLWLDRAALLSGDLARVFEVLQQGINSPEHAQFVAALKARRG
jgi:Uma2 family endonuclease